jgi:hypothetical protein
MHEQMPHLELVRVPEHTSVECEKRGTAVGAADNIADDIADEITSNTADNMIEHTYSRGQLAQLMT